MSEIITISCPSCGGMLTRAPNTTTYTCDYCGQSHRLRMEDVEEFGRCPICRRNDRVEIVRAIYNKGGNLARLLAPPRDPTETLYNNPPPQPAPTDKPARSRTKSKYLFIGFSLLAFSFVLFSTLCCGIGIIDYKNSHEVSYLSIFSIIMLIVFISAIVFVVVGLVQSKKQNDELDKILLNEWEQQNREIINKWSSRKDQYHNAYKQKSSQLEDSHQKTMRRYDQLYYCHRDDIVFIPGESGHAPSDQLENFLYQKPTEK